ncbi:uncharacterized protein N7511_007266 [Penicillium nucicola]|uniref:uncharacterized protein n=1 Tax=Penicillium nucicola TaxID=1850975 RepID=UPI0025451EC5|nr:uncharacterized protein N7511_007266 [Penicillium nucicola]KAJ5757084.1 hypothetical protein N7511_007266 [Penicillium nucicola]
MLDFLANLRSRFEYRYGGVNGRKIGVKLTLWGHTILIKPAGESPQETRAKVCREALEQLRVFNMLWKVPPQPMDGPTDSSWDWMKILEGYQPYSNNGRKWYCDLYVNGKPYRITKPVSSRDEAENTVAHLAVHEIMIEKGSDIQILPYAQPQESSILVTLPVQKQIASFLRANTAAPKKSGPTAANQYAGVKKPNAKPKSTAPAKPQPTNTRVSRSRGAKKKAQNAQKLQQAASTQSDMPAQPNALAQLNAPAQSNASEASNVNDHDCHASVSNMVPVAGTRFVPIEAQDRPVDDPLATLKAIANIFSTLDHEASITMIMQTPVMPAQARAVVAHFNGAHPYLNRASPIHLAYVITSNDDSAMALGVKHLILYILNIAKEDAGLDDCGYPKELGVLQALEDECNATLETLEIQDEVFIL